MIGPERTKLHTKRQTYRENGKPLAISEIVKIYKTLPHLPKKSTMEIGGKGKVCE